MASVRVVLPVGVAEEGGGAGVAEVPGEGTAIGLAEVDDDEGVEGRVEVLVEVEGGDAATEAEVVAEQDGNAGRVGFDVAEAVFELVEGARGGEG